MHDLSHSLFLASSLVIGFATSSLAQTQQPETNPPGNFSSPPGQAVTGRRSAATGAARVLAHSPRDDQGQWSPTDFAKANRTLPTLVIAGDSTAATGDPAHRGWGAPLMDYFETNRVNVINRARGGRSFRTFYGEGAWQQIVAALKPGDFVVIQFGHNDGGSISNAPARGDLPGIGDETAEVPRRDGTMETVHTYGWYARKFIRDVKEKGATPILASTTVRSIWRNPNATFRDSTIVSQQDSYNPAEDRVERGLGRMFGWAKEVAETEKVAFLDHSNITADRYEKMGREQVAKLFPADHTHTSTDGAVLNAETFIAGLKALPNMPLVNFLNDKGKAIESWKPTSATK